MDQLAQQQARTIAALAEAVERLSDQVAALTAYLAYGTGSQHRTPVPLGQPETHSPSVHAFHTFDTLAAMTREVAHARAQRGLGTPLT